MIIAAAQNFATARAVAGFESLKEMIHVEVPGSNRERMYVDLRSL